MAVANAPVFADTQIRKIDVNGKKTNGMGSRFIKNKTKQDVLKRSSESLREASFEKPDPCGQPDPAPAIEPEPLPIKKKARSKKEILLLTAENIENQDFRFTVGSVSQAEIILRTFSLKCHSKDCTGPFCGEHGAFRATSQECHNNLDMEDMAMPYIEQLDPINFLCLKCLESSGLEEKLMGKSSLKHIREDIRVNEIVVCERPLRAKIIDRIKEPDEVQVV